MISDLNRLLELALLVRVHCAVVHAEAPVGCHVSAALEGSLETLETLGTHLVLALVDPLGRDLRLAGGPVLHVEALAARHTLGFHAETQKLEPPCTA